jgi:predicted dehydrogenase
MTGELNWERIMYNVGILGNCCTHGVGIASSFNARKDIKIIAGYESEPHRANELSNALGFALGGSYGDILQNPDVDIVVITTDPCDKAEMVEKACKAGKHIFLNKPFCHTLADANRIVKAVEKSGVRLVFDIPMVKYLSALSKLKEEILAGKYGKIISYYHAFGMTFPMDFPIRELWPERFDPPEKSGGGEMTNMGCYAIDFVVTLFGMPTTVQAKWMKFWKEYQESNVENFGQIILDYGDFYAMLSVGKQKLIDEPIKGNNSLSLLFEHTNVFVDPYSETLIINGISKEFRDYLAGYESESSIDQLLRCIEAGEEPESNVRIGAMGVEVLMAAYRSIVNYGRIVFLPLKEQQNPLFLD